MMTNPIPVELTEEQKAKRRAEFDAEVRRVFGIQFIVNETKKPRRTKIVNAIDVESKEVK